MLSDMREEMTRISIVLRTKDYTAHGGAIALAPLPLFLSVMAIVGVIVLWDVFQHLPYHNLLASVVLLQVLRG